MTDTYSMNENVLAGKTFLVVDDEIDLRDIVASEFEFMGAKVFQAENIAKAEQIISSEPIDLVVSDIRMPGGTGIDLLEYIKTKNANSPSIILITGFADITLEDAFAKGAEALMNKPFKLDDLIRLAVRFTSPVENRYLENYNGPQKELMNHFQVSILEKMALHECDIGRGGLAIEMNYQGIKYELGEIVHFTLEFTDQKLEGTAICRWFKLDGPGSGKASIGLEFVHLSKDTLKYLIRYWQNEVPKSYIPSLEVR